MRPLPYPRPDQLVVLWERQQALGKAQEKVSAQNFLDWRSDTRAFGHLAAWTEWGLALTGSGIRIALGALPREILRLVLSQGVWLAGLGILAGLAGALATTRMLASMLFEVRPNDPPTYVVTALTLALVALVATLLPALRATRVDPIESMRSE